MTCGESASENFDPIALMAERASPTMREPGGTIMVSETRYVPAGKNVIACPALLPRMALML
tara:strand:- start:1369 stop:1551 length:183 start_codon:yes stop_codon:yes gene_type:complete